MLSCKAQASATSLNKGEEGSGSLAGRNELLLQVHIQDCSVH